MFGTIRKHQKWLWAIIATLTIISFVWFFSPYAKMNNVGGGAAENLASISGHKVTLEAYQEAWREVNLLYFFLSGGTWPNDESKQRGFDVETETYKWLFLVQKQEELKIQPGSELVAQMGTQLLGPILRKINATPAQFIEQALVRSRGYMVADFERFVRHYVGRQELAQTLGISGDLVTPAEAQALYERERQDMSVSLMLFSATNYEASVTVTPEALAQFYTNKMSEYRIPEHVQVEYVRFAITNYETEISAELAKPAYTNINQNIETVYQQRGTNFYHDIKPEEAKEKIRKEFRRDIGLSVVARGKAKEFAVELYKMQPSSPQCLSKLAAQKSLTVKLTAPFDAEEGPKDIAVGEPFVKEAFRLSPTNAPFVGPVLGEDGYYVIAYHGVTPSRIPALAEIRDRVISDYKFQQATSVAHMKAAVFYQTLTNGLAEKKSFAAICEASSVKSLDLPPFSLSTTSLAAAEDNHIQLNQLKQVAFSTSSGKPSAPLPTADGSALIFVRGRLPVDAVKMKTELPAFIDRVRQSRQSEAFDDWFRHEANKALVDTPLNKQAPAPSSMTSSKAKK